MIVAMLCVYLVLLFALVKLGVIRFNLFWKVSPFIVLLLLNLGLFIPMGWGAQCGLDRAERGRRGDRRFGRGEQAA